MRDILWSLALNACVPFQSQTNHWMAASRCARPPALSVTPLSAILPIFTINQKKTLKALKHLFNLREEPP